MAAAAGMKVAAGVRAAGGGRMLAWRLHSYGGLGELRLDNSRVPPLRRTDEVLVQVHAAGLNPLDVGMAGGYGSRVLNMLRQLEGSEMEFPLVLGRDLCGTVVRGGSAARLRPGTRVWAALPPHRPGALAQFVVLRDSWAGEAPRALDAASAGGALYAALTACSALRAGGMLNTPRSRGARVLLLGLGGVGQAALQLLAAGGAQVVAGCAAEQAELARRLGAVEALDRHAADYERALEQGGPYALVLDCSGAGGWAASERRWRLARYVTLSSPLLRETDARGLLAGGARALADLGAQNLALRRAQPAGAAVLSYIIGSRMST
ncbi:unnamed protein product [Leptidea sinapis]|uniref:Enoyl reductase (ER) domain-containing protein n=1 Tax=Leptidea sinapis TaxID=189913 RepID=A0A5E4PPC9_9NEOP|nr:unnamed protein product [Leptidea sinapis]